ncbi:RND transporter [Marinobacterium nitratireducens]|uniref:RND transporter n=1 Tax=Marinobacterium nitratireducens TaxID=518897 RepID=A0A917ZCJ2_9GAMM|nr:MMPL family transporter [Marinobacterium nitratireducens]GGO80870.1 RND transporter [Marinobacterium nitratireducens]
MGSLRTGRRERCGLGAVKGFVERYLTFVTANPVKVLIGSMVLAALLMAGMSQLTFRSDNRVFFADDNPELQQLERFEQLYGRDDNLIYVVKAREGDLFTPERLNAINEITDAAWALPDVKRVDSVTNFQRVRAVGDDIEIDHLARSGDSLTAAQARQLKADSVLEPLLIDRLLSRDGTLGLVVVQFSFQADTASAQSEVAMAAGQKTLDRFALQYPDLELGLSGSVALDHAFVEASTYDSSVLLPIMLVILLLIIVVALRSVVGAVATFLVIMLSTLCALGLSAMLGIPLSSPSVIAPNIILTLATCDCIHICAGMMRHRRSGLGRPEAVKMALLECWWPVTLTTLTTSIGFLTLSFSAVPPFAHLGIIVAIGSLMAWFLSVSFFPALLCVLPWRGKDSSVPAERFSGAVARIVLANPRRLLAGISAVAVVLCSLAFTNVLDDRYVRYFDQSFSFREATDRMNEDLGGFYILEFSLDSREEGGIATPQYLQEVDAFAGWLRQQPGVTHVHGLPDIMKTVNRAMQGGDANAYALPGNRDLAAQYLALYEMSLPFGTDLRNQLTADKRYSRLSVSLNDISTRDMTDLQARAEAWAADNTTLVAASARATGTSLLFAHIGNRNIQEMLQGIAMGVLVVWVIFLVAFRSLALSLIGTFANFIPCLATLGIWALINGEVGMAVATVASVTFGVVVDATIHMLCGFVRMRRDRGASSAEAVRATFESVGPGLVTMTLSLAAGFLCLAFSGFQINAWMGTMAALTIFVALLFDLFFMPAILLLLKPRQQGRGAVAMEAQ